MKYTFFIACLVLPSLLFAQRYQRIHRKAVLVDTHNDILSTCVEKGYSFDEDLRGKTHSDLDRMRKAKMDVQVFSVWCDGSYTDGAAYNMAIRQIDTLYAAAARNPAKMRIIRNPGDLEQALNHGLLAAMLGVEGGHMIENNPAYLDTFYNRGVVYLTLTWNNSTSWATSARDETRDSLLHQPKGLNDFGRQVVKRMNELGMMIDVSHIGEQTFWDVMKTTTKPVLASHSDAWALTHVPRNLKDSQVIAIAKNGGVIDVNFYPGFVDSTFERKSDAFNARHKQERDSLLARNPESYYASDFLFNKYKDEIQEMRPPLSLLLDHIDYLVKLAGINHVGLGSDLDGISSTPLGINDITDYPILTKALLKRGYRKKEVNKILGGNFLRVYKANRKR